MALLSTNYRRLKSIDGLYSFETAAELKAESLCSACWRHTCFTREVIGSLNESNEVLTTVKRCQHFIPALTFFATDGLDAPAFNTIRLGTAWDKRLHQGGEVALLLVKTGMIFATVEVVSTVAGNLYDLCHRYAHKNHMLLGSAPGTVTDAMLSIMRRANGSMYVHETATATVINLCEKTSHAKT
ncbi:hypothetical protein AY600_02075 [Phormidium willei BDU 130791]|nr:hypothetical protein AY600_02075 [Phormidium willei BDU 130791]